MNTAGVECGQRLLGGGRDRHDLHTRSADQLLHEGKRGLAASDDERGQTMQIQARAPAIAPPVNRLPTRIAVQGWGGHRLSAHESDSQGLPFFWWKAS